LIADCIIFHLFAFTGYWYEGLHWRFFSVEI
jgi:hypothetical protein